MKIIIAGDGKIGSTLTRQLAAEGYELTIVDIDPKVLDDVENNFDIIAVCGNCATMETLSAAGVDKADLLIAVSNADEINILCCMTAHSMNKRIHTIARVRDPEYIDQTYLMRDLMGLSMIVNPEKSAAMEISRLLKYPGFLKRDTFAKGRVEIVELKVSRDSKLCDVSMSRLYYVLGCKVLVCAIVRGGNCVIPGGTDVIREGDRIFVTAPSDTLNSLLKSLGMVTRKVHNCLIIGGGRIGFYLAKLLMKAGIRVKIIDSDHSKCVALASALPGASIIEGDGSVQSLLHREGLESYDSVVSLTGLDELNAMLSLYCNSHKISNIVTKIDRIENSSMLDALSIGSIVRPKELAGNEIVRYVRAMQNQTGAAVTVHSIADGMAEALEFNVTQSTRHIGQPLKKIRLREHVLIACITHGSTTEIPDGESVFNPGDSVIIVTDGNVIVRQINDIFQ